MSDPRDLRDYGYGDSDQYVRGLPKVSAETGMTCPSCGCDKTYKITVPIEHPLLRGQTGTGHYFGCPACPWASPCMMIADQTKGTKHEKRKYEDPDAS